MRRLVQFALILVALLVLAAPDADARRRGGSFGGSSSSSSCAERDSEGNCLHYRQNGSLESSSGGRSSSDDMADYGSGGPGIGGMSWIYYVLAFFILTGSAGWKFMQRGAAGAVATVGSVVRSRAEASANSQSDWAVKASSRFGGVANAPEPVAAAPAATAAAAPPSSYGGPKVTVANRAQPKQQRSAGFGQSGAVTPAPAASAEPVRQTASSHPAAASAAPAQRAAARPAAVAAAAPAGRGFGAAERPRAGVEPRATFGTRR